MTQLSHSQTTTVMAAQWMTHIPRGKMPEDVVTDSSRLFVAVFVKTAHQGEKNATVL